MSGSPRRERQDQIVADAPSSPCSPEPSHSTIETITTFHRHLRFGWWSLFAWLALGIILETLHGFKARWLLDVGHDTRRLMLRLAHAHGTFLALVNLAAALTSRLVNGFALARSASFSLLWSAVLIPLGFLLGGIVTHGGDPGLGVWLVPPGAFLLLYAVGRIARDLK